MNLTPAQVQTLKAFVEADPVLAPKLAAGDDQFVADALNATASPAYVVWKTSVSLDEIMLNGFDWARVDNLSVGKARIWEWMGQFGSINPSKPNIRAGIDATWVGTAADLAVRAAVYAHCKRNASVVEKVLATGTGTTESPATMGAEGPISPAEVSTLRS